MNTFWNILKWCCVGVLAAYLLYVVAIIFYFYIFLEVFNRGC